MSAIETMMLIVIQSQSDLIQKLVTLLEAKGVEPPSEVDDAIRKLSHAMSRYEQQLDYEMKKLSGTETH